MDVATLSREWQRIGPLGLEAKTRDVEHFKQRLRLIVARDYGWLVSELYDIEGKLGWGPGHREWDEDGYPPPTEDSYAHMTTFLRTLASVHVDTGLVEALREASDGRWKSVAGKYIAKSLHARETIRNSVILRYYGWVADTRNEYTVGGARIYRYLWEQQNLFWLSCAGLIWLLFNPLNTILARAKTAEMRINTPRYIRDNASYADAAQKEPLLQQIAC